jgi:glycine cleavage system P protein (glycine dehydrogenase) subunit 2
LSIASPNNQRPRAGETKLLFESGSTGRSAALWPTEPGQVEDVIPASLLRRDIPGFPELGELEVLRHFTRLSQRNFAIESQFYPLGSCTMKYNPKINEVVARFPGFAQIHPLAPPDLLQGALALLYELERALAEISGMEEVSLPATLRRRARRVDRLDADPRVSG